MDRSDNERGRLRRGEVRRIHRMGFSCKKNQQESQSLLEVVNGRRASFGLRWYQNSSSSLFHALFKYNEPINERRRTYGE